MKIKKILAVLTLALSATLFANGINNVSALVEQINNAADLKEKQVLMKKLNNELAVLDKKDVPKAKEIIDTKLKK